MPEMGLSQLACDEIFDLPLWKRILAEDRVLRKFKALPESENILDLERINEHL